ncbi:PAS domain-containing protein [Roseicyclus sp. F158]|uniref:PAS domain-containing protein n=1 Tax=Tropicimonas omnivorans TaxID=3075590 RepID=A0ABU3DDD2_9RHOB|nr:PAS domain-containing protein [Roseicyclus sp. F158]MDT0681724.1 PAS domain-containing protein [Roseicyclus sp. F158]
MDEQSKQNGLDPALERVSEMFDRSPIALTLADTRRDDVPLILANQSFLDICGYSRDEVVGRNCRFLQSDLDNSAARAELKEALAAGTNCQVVLSNRRKNGEIFDNLLFMQALQDREGTPIYFIGSQFELERNVTKEGIDNHLGHINDAVRSVIETQSQLRSEQRRMLANAAFNVASAYLSLSNNDT